MPARIPKTPKPQEPERKDWIERAQVQALLDGLDAKWNQVLGAGDLDATIAAFGDMSIDIVVTGSGLSTANVGQAVWSAIAAANNDPGTMGEKMNSAASAGDPWGTALPGGYAEGTAGFIVGNMQSGGSGGGSVFNTVPTGFALTTGIETNTYADALARGGNRHTLDDVGNVIDGYYTANIGILGRPASVTFYANVQGGNDGIEVSQWNYDTSAWAYRGLIPGTGGIGLAEYSITLLSDAAYASDGEIRLRVAAIAGATNTRFDNDEMVIGYSVRESAYTFVGRAQAGGTSNQIIFPASASSASDFYRPGYITIISGAGAGQGARRMESYDGTTKVAVLATDWAPGYLPDATSVFAVTPFPSVRVSDMDAAVLNAIAAVAGLDAGQAAQLLDLWQRLGLDPANPQVTTATSIVAGGVDQTITETAGPTITVTRNP